MLSVQVQETRFSLKDDTPDKGTETQLNNPIWIAFSLLKDDTPDKGTETRSCREKGCQCLLKDDTPDKGTETLAFSASN